MDNTLEDNVLEDSMVDEAGPSTLRQKVTPWMLYRTKPAALKVGPASSPTKVVARPPVVTHSPVAANSNSELEVVKLKKKTVAEGAKRAKACKRRRPPLLTAVQ